MLIFKKYNIPYDKYDTGYSVKTVEKKTYAVSDGKTIYKLFDCGTYNEYKSNFKTPQLNISGFEGCPHVYGKIYYKGNIYEIRHKMTEEFLKRGKASGGDWAGYKAGEFTQRFLDRETLTNVFELFKELFD